MRRWGKLGARARAALWDEEIDGQASKPADRIPAGKGAQRSRLERTTRGAGLILFFAWVLLVGAGPVEHIRFGQQVHAVDQQARGLGGGVIRGRRDFSDHVGIWFHGPEIDDHSMPGILSIIRECRARGLGDPHLSLSLDRTSIGDEGIRRLQGVEGLESISLRETGVTEKGVADLRRSLPRTAVYAGLRSLPDPR